MVDMFAKRGKIGSAQKMFDEMVKRNGIYRYA
jgi:pentatricopeptide repeat protein